MNSMFLKSILLAITALGGMGLTSTPVATAKCCDGKGCCDKCPTCCKDCCGADCCKDACCEKCPTCCKA